MNSTLNALRYLRITYYKVLECWSHENSILDSNVSLENYPFDTSFDEIGLVVWIEEILEKYCDDWNLTEDSKRTEEDYNLNLDERILKALKEFRYAWYDVIDGWYGEGSSILDSDISLEMYPFNSLFDEINVPGWIESILDKFERM